MTASQVETKPETTDASDDESPVTDKTPTTESAKSVDEPCRDVPFPTRLEAILVSTDRALSDPKLAEILGIPRAGAAKRIRAAIEELNAGYEQAGRSFRIEKLAGGHQILTLPAYGPLLTRLHKERQQSKLSQAALETLSIIAYRQPVMRAEIEAIRGVACGEVLRGLMERRLVRIAGRAEELGRPMLYGTTREFLKVFGLANLEDLPAVEGLDPTERRRKAETASSATEGSAGPTLGDPEPAEAPADESEPS